METFVWPTDEFSYVVMFGTRMVKAARILREEGPLELLSEVAEYLYYRHLRHLLPRRTVNYSGYTVREPRLFDSLLARHTFHRPGYESGIISSLSERVRPDDEVVIVGGGVGVTAVAAAERVGPGGGVTVFEGAAGQLDMIRETAALNEFTDRITVRHAVVGPEVRLRGDAAGAATVAPADLPDCDVLELDCEGAELAILEELEIRPRVLIVETHGMLGAPRPEVRDRLSALSYDVVDEAVADADQREACVRNDVFVLTAVASGSQTETTVEGDQ